MYSCQLRISVFTAHPEEFRVLSACPVPPRFSVTLQSFSQADEAGLQAGDVVVWDLPLPLPDEAACKPEAVLVLCSEKAEIALDSPGGFSGHALWERPFSPGYLRFRFGQLLTFLKERKDHWLTRTWLDTVIDSIPDLVWFKDVRGSHLKVNQSFCQAVGKTKAQVEGRGHYYIWDLEPEEYEKGEYVCLETEEQVIAARKTCLFDEKVKSKEGLRQFKTYKSPVFDGDEVIGTVGVAHDVTDLQNMGAEIEIILRSLPFSVLVTDVTGTIVNANLRFEKFFSVKKSKVIGCSYESWKQSTFRGEPGDQAGDWLLKLGDEVHTLEVREEPIDDVFGTTVGYFAICRDVTIERAYEQKIRRNANTDFLTGLHNRRYFQEYMEKHWKKGVGILYLDLDHFKYVNDTYGHQVGDRALTLTGEALHRACPQGVIARVGGDEFLVGLWGVTPETLADYGNQVIAAVEQAMGESPQTRTLSTSVGGAVQLELQPGEKPGTALDELVRRGDVALYVAKGQGRKRFCLYTPEMDQREKGEIV